MSAGSQPPRPLSLQPHKGTSVDIVIGIDVGTTFSGVSYAFLRPGEVPEVQTVTRFTDQTSGDNKIPSVVYYDKDQKLKAAGATAVSDSTAVDSEFENWKKVEYFKMHLRPANMQINTNGLKLSSLPQSLTAVKVMGDFLRYLFQETLRYIETHHSDGNELLRKVKGRETFVLSHPNGWDGLSQQRMREAAIVGGLIGGSTSQRTRLRFVSEGEASALACLAGGLCPADLHPGYRFIIADAGGGTLDMTSYEVIGTSPLRLKELTSSDCRFAGSVFINLKARELLQKKLRGSQYDNPDILDELINDSFENTAKRQFSDASKTTWLKIGNRSENNAALGIRNGLLRIAGSELASCFKFSIDEALKSVKHQIELCGRKPMPVWLVGGFGSSPWLFKQLKEALGHNGIVVSRPDINLSKAVANGDVQYALTTEHTVMSRVTRASYGIESYLIFSPSLTEHNKRAFKSYEDVDGIWKVPGAFSTIVKKNTEVQELDHFTESFYNIFKTAEDATTYSAFLYCYEGPLPVPEWFDVNKGLFRHVCTIRANLSSMCRKSNKSVNRKTGAKYWKLSFELVLMFGLTELQAKVKWDDNGITKYGPATIFFEE